VHFLPPYDRRGEDNRNLLSADVEGAYGYFSPCAVPQSETNSLLPDGALAFRQTYQKPEWGFKNAIGKSDVVPSAGRYIEDIYQFQSEAYLQMIRGERPLEYFDDFVREWRERGGDVLTVEANAVRHEMQEVFRQVGVPAHQSTPREGIE